MAKGERATQLVASVLLCFGGCSKLFLLGEFTDDTVPFLALGGFACCFLRLSGLP